MTGLKVRTNAAFTRVELVVACFVLLATLLLFIPALNRTDDKSQRIKCVSNLKNLGLSFRIFATDHQDLFPFQLQTNGTSHLTDVGDAFRHFQILSNEIYV